MDDVTPMERLEYVEESSAVWHFALNAMHMIMRLHFGDSVLDPGSLAKHKGLLNRTWDTEKPNYADSLHGDVNILQLLAYAMADWFTGSEKISSVGQTL